MTQIRRGSPAHRLRVRVGDVVVAVNRKEIRRVRDLEAVLRQPVGTWEITLNRNGRVHTLEVEG